MAIVFDNSEISSATASSGSHAHAVASGTNRAMLFVVVCNRSGLSVTYNSVAATLLHEVVSGGVRASLWYLVNPSTGTNNVGWTMDSSGSNIIASISLTGVSQLNPIGASNTENETTSSESDFDLTLQYASSWTVECQAATSAVSFTQNDGQTEREHAEPGLSLSLSTKPHTLIGSANLGFTPSGNTEVFHIAAEVVDSEKVAGNGTMFITI